MVATRIDSGLRPTCRMVDRRVKLRSPGRVIISTLREQIWQSLCSPVFMAVFLDAGQDIMLLNNDSNYKYRYLTNNIKGTKDFYFKSIL